MSNYELNYVKTELRVTLSGKRIHRFGKMCLFIGSTKTVITLLASAAISDAKTLISTLISQREKGFKETTKRNTLNLKIYIYWHLLNLVKLMGFMSVTKSLNGKVNVNFCIFTLASICYRTKVLSTGMQTCSKYPCLGFISSHTSPSSSESEVAPGRETKYCNLLIHNPSCDIIRGTSKWH